MAVRAAAAPQPQDGRPQQQPCGIHSRCPACYSCPALYIYGLPETVQESHYLRSPPSQRSPIDCGMTFILHTLHLQAQIVLGFVHVHAGAATSIVPRSCHMTVVVLLRGHLHGNGSETPTALMLHELFTARSTFPARLQWELLMTTRMRSGWAEAKAPIGPHSSGTLAHHLSTRAVPLVCCSCGTLRGCLWSFG